MSARGIPKIVIAGGGPAALEALLALRDWLEPNRARICLIAPNRTLGHRPLSSVVEFATHPEHELSLASIAAATDAKLVSDSVALVEPGRLLTRDGSWITYDQLLIAIGAFERRLPRGWIGWPAQGDPQALLGLIGDIADATSAIRISVYIPDSSGWPLAGYELALILAHAARAESAADVSVELLAEGSRPLAVLGERAEAVVEAELRAAGLELQAGTRVEEPPPAAPRGGEDWMSALTARVLGRTAAQRPAPTGVPVLVRGERARFDRFVALPANRGPALPGLGTDRHGYVAIDEHCRVLGVKSVWAAGDCTPLALKHSTLAVAQAECAAAGIAAAAGAEVEPHASEPVLTGILVSGAAARWSTENASRPAGLEPAAHCLWWPSGKVLGRRLARFFARRDRAARPLLLGHPHGTAIQVTFPPPATVDARPPSPAREDNAIEVERAHDAFQRRVFALQRVERAAERQLEEMEEELRRAHERSAEVLARLNAAGYLVKDDLPMG
ncbi:MAG: FAD-dependent oxidoreductase [bacterium]